MPVHDWTRVPSGLFHHFHQDWSIEIARRLNGGALPKGFSALVEQRNGPWEADVLTVEARTKVKQPSDDNGSATQTFSRPATRIVRTTDKESYAGRANRIVVKHHLGRTVAVIEILSPGNKHSKSAIREFVEKTIDYRQSGVHVLLIDLFPPTPRDPHGIHKLIWDEFIEEEFIFPAGHDRLLASYEIGSAQRTAFVESVAVGDALPEMPLFLSERLSVQMALESTYCATWDASPEELRVAVATGELPIPEE